MPTLIRLIVVLVVLAVLAYGAMFALVASVTPTQKDVTIRIPARDLVAAPERDPLVRREIDTTRRPDTPVAAPSTAVPPPAAAEEGDVETRQQGIE